MPNCPGLCDLLENQAQWEQWEPVTASPTETPNEMTELPVLESTTSAKQASSFSVLARFVVAGLLSAYILWSLFVVLRGREGKKPGNRRDYELVPVVKEGVSC